MKFRQLLNEKWFHTFDFNGETIEVFINPSKSEINQLLKLAKGDGVRMASIGKDIYVWLPYVLHGIMEEMLLREKKIKKKWDLHINFDPNFKDYFSIVDRTGSTKPFDINGKYKWLRDFAKTKFPTVGWVDWMYGKDPIKMEFK